MPKILFLTHAVLLASYTSSVVSVGNNLPSLTSLVSLNSNNTRLPSPWSTLPTEGCCHGLPDPAAGGRDAICLVQEKSARTPTSVSRRGIDPFHTSREECRAAIDSSDGSCRWTDPDADLDAGTSATYCVTWSETCPWEQLEAQRTCRTRCRDGECFLSALSREEEQGKPLLWIFFAITVVIVGMGGFLRRYTDGKSCAAADADIEKNTAHAKDGTPTEG
eukprot:CAMPEP_0194280728 /NCGR_PEP_ID=MMETSP0169-20130528/18528_1 /TAXON_ID=218684 /ORGANISM="Corethron pennatum, Strain L29A3" /LENGTH=219 /DNA_ID=CAMNT_0039025569 /DNA_START=85 /DNA_END=744 /DNA_ORIENTATION=+